MDDLKPVPAVLPGEAQQLVDDGALLVDIREWNEWAASRIPGAVFRPMSEINDWYHDLPEDRTVILQCRTGNRSGVATGALLNQAGMTNVYNLTGGIVEWARLGLPVDEAPVET
ncbi:MAG: rhodanese-like domain-containing protein [Acidimicrobiia bacterium]|nr:rhodanese-like domain-containing protein [Acidimicrobiia bacterium]